ncbi:MAG: hypothetical protein GEV07_05475 [Streptosporangiales bacterium]|nr:hypothetical protein [Streptosporangiales bacterium]
MFNPVSLDGAALGDSWVLDIDVRPGEVVFELDLVLLPGHPAYEPPEPGEEYCYRRASLRFGGLREVTWRLGDSPPWEDPEDELDYGNIDTLRTDGEVYELDGDWGAMRLVADPPLVDLQ